MKWAWEKPSRYFRVMWSRVVPSQQSDCADNRHELCSVLLLCLFLVERRSSFGSASMLVAHTHVHLARIIVSI